MAEFSDLIAELNKLGKEGNQAAIKEFFDSLSAKTKDLGEKVERLSGTINSSRKVTNETIESDKELITTYDELIKKYKELIELGDEYILQDKESLELLEKRRDEIELCRKQKGIEHCHCEECEVECQRLSYYPIWEQALDNALNNLERIERTE